MNSRFAFDDRLFQRGQRWQECLEEWSFQRAVFLEYVQRRPTLSRSLDFLNRLPPYRVAVIYSFFSLDSLLSIPSLGWTFQAAKKVTARYFCLDHFFPLFADPFGKRTPHVVILNYQGFGVKIWGPRPKEVTSKLAKQAYPAAHEADQAFIRLVEEWYPAALDRSLYRRLTVEFGDTVVNH